MAIFGGDPPNPGIRRNSHVIDLVFLPVLLLCVLRGGALHRRFLQVLGAVIVLSSSVE